MPPRRDLERQVRRQVSAVWHEAAALAAPIEHDLDYVTGPTEVLIQIGYLRRELDKLEVDAVRWARHPRTRGSGYGLVSWAKIGRYLYGWTSREAARRRFGDLVD